MEVGARLGNICLWCDHFFEHHFDIKQLRASNSNVIPIVIPVLVGQSSNPATQHNPKPSC